MLGAYERGERAISVPRLQRLAKFYNVPVDQLLPKDAGVEPDWSSGSDEEIDVREIDDDEGKVTIDLLSLDADDAPERTLVGRYLSTIQVQRQDFNGRVLTIRREDLRAISCLLDVQPGIIRRRLAELGLRH